MPGRAHPRTPAYGLLEGARRHHDVVGLEAAVARGDQRSRRVPRHPVHAHSRAHRQAEASGVGLEVVGHLVLRRERPGVGGKPPSRQTVVAGRAVQAQGVEAPAPAVADPLVGLEEHELLAALRQVVCDRQARLAAADDDRLVALALVARAHHATAGRAPSALRRRPRTPPAARSAGRCHSRRSPGAATRSAHSPSPHPPAAWRGRDAPR